MNDLEEAKELFKAAEKDLRGLIGLLTIEEMIAEEFFGQHVQQAIEKLLKSWISALGEKFPYTHDLEQLLLQLDNLDCDVDSYWALVDFTDFGVRFRYEGVLTDSEPIEREPAVAQVQQLYEQVESVLEQLELPENQTGKEEDIAPKSKNLTD